MHFVKLLEKPEGQEPWETPKVNYRAWKGQNEVPMPTTLVSNFTLYELKDIGNLYMTVHQ
jgi:hypothetical protein